MLSNVLITDLRASRTGTPEGMAPLVMVARVLR